MKPVDALVEFLRREGIRMNPGAQESQLAELGQLLGGVLPSDVSEFYKSLNGIPETQLAPHMVGFWSIERIHQELENWGDSHVGFADVMLNSYRFIFKPTPTGIRVFTENVVPGTPLREIGTLESFLSKYLNDPESLDLA